LAATATSDFTKLFFKILSPIFVIAWSSLILALIVFLTQRERNETITEFQSVLVTKLTLLQFLNAGLFVVAAKILVGLSSFDLGNGIVQQVTIIMILNATVPNLIRFATNYFEVFNKVELWMVKRGWLFRSQLEVNRLSEGPSLNMPRRYAYILKTLWLTALYAPTIPIVVGISILGLLLFYLL
jgi:hypothetical protein